MPHIWDPTAALQPGLTVLEASAGTGKTWQISSLVVRLVAEQGISIDRILVVTFTRAATAELTDRVRGRLAEALAVCRQGELAADPGDDPVLKHLAGLAPKRPELEQRLRLALEAFDQAAISTIHGFCQRTLAENAFESGTPGDLTLEASADALAEQVAIDRFTSTRHDASPQWAEFLDGPCALNVDGYRGLAGVAAGADGRILPAPGPVDAAHPPEEGVPDDEDLRADLAALVRAGELAWLTTAIAQSAESANLATFDDLLRRLARGLDPEHTPDADRRAALRAAIRKRYRVALIDEFQDTDSVQWQIFREVFTTSPATAAVSAVSAISAATTAPESHSLYLIGDPKQSIYGFRGANIQVYLAAVTGPSRRRATLNRNHRSDEPLVAALNTLWLDAHHALQPAGVFVETDIQYTEVQAAKPVRLLRTAVAGRSATTAKNALPAQPATIQPAPVQLRWFEIGSLGGMADSDAPKSASKPGADSEAEAKNGPELLASTQAKKWLPDRVAADLVEVLDGSWQRNAGSGFRPLHPGDCAVLVRTNAEAQQIRAALRAVGVPAIVHAGESVFDAPEREHLLCWIRAVSDPTNDGAARRLAVSPLFGFDALFLLALDDESPAEVARWDRWRSELREAAVRFERRGLIGALRPMLDAYDVLSRILTAVDGERAVTNLLHLAELCHGAWQRERLGLPGLAKWLGAGGEQSGLDAETYEQRLESDAAAVQILTVHKSKGLQFPVVFLPYLWASRDGELDDGKALRLPDPQRPLSLCIDVHPKKHPEREPRLTERGAATIAEQMRLAYVALTRAEHLCMVYWGPVTSHKKPVYARSPITPLLFPWAPDSDRFDGIDGIESASANDSEADDGGAATAVLRRLWSAVAQTDLDALKADLMARAQSPAWRDHIEVSVCAPVPQNLRWRPPTPEFQPAALAARTYTRGAFDPRWRIHSYTSLTRGQEGSTNLEAVGADHDDVVPDDERVGAEGAAPGLESRPVAENGGSGNGRGDNSASGDGFEDAEDRALTPLASFPAGTHAGTFLHRILERATFDGEPEARRANIAEVVNDEGPRYGFAPAQYGAELVEGLARALETPLGGPLQHTRLADITRENRADELRFHLALGRNDLSRGGERPSHLADRPLGNCFEVPEQPRPDGLPEAYVAGLKSLRFGAIAGYLTGAIDLVFHHEGRWFVADYKSNRLHPRSARALENHYEAPRLAQEMSKHHYYLQAYLYTVALHRHLGRRQRGYDPELHLGGVCYLFLRGMNGAFAPAAGDVSAATGCVSFRPDLRVVRALDAHLAGEPLPELDLSAPSAQVQP